MFPADMLPEEPPDEPPEEPPDEKEDVLTNPTTRRSFPSVAGHGNIVYGSSGSLYKIMRKSDNEYHMYQYLRTRHQTFCDRFVPKLLGTERNMLKLEDVTYNYVKPHVMDIKIGSRKRGKRHTCRDFSIKGYTDSETYEFNPKVNMAEEDTVRHLVNFLSKCPDKTYPTAWIASLTTIASYLKTIDLNFAGMSIMLLYDESPTTAATTVERNGTVYLVDFNRAERTTTHDEAAVVALESLISLFKSIVP